MTGSTSRAAVAITPEAIAVAAVNLIDAEGLEHLSMRRLAATLEVTTGALYWHFSDRTAVLAAATAQVQRNLDLPDEALPWDVWIPQFAHAYRRLLHQHPHMASMISTELTSNSRSEFTLVEAILCQLARAGFRRESLIEAYNVCVAFIVGFVVVELSGPPRENQEQWVTQRRRDLQSVGADEPTMAANRNLLEGAFIVRWRGGSEQPMDRAFVASIEVLMDGLHAKVKRESGPAARRRRVSRG